MLSECANATVILGSPSKTVIVQLHGIKEIAAQPANQAPQYSCITGQILFEMHQSCKFAHLFHQNLMFTDQAIVQLLPNSQVKEVHKFEPSLSALCRISSKYILTVDPDLFMRVFLYDSAKECYRVVAKERLECLMTMSTNMTHDLLVIDKI